MNQESKGSSGTNGPQEHKTEKTVHIPVAGLANAVPISGDPSESAVNAAMEMQLDKMSKDGAGLLLSSLNAALDGDVVGAGEKVWDMSEEDVNAGLTVLHVMTQALLAQGTNYHLGRQIAAEGFKATE